MKELFFYAPDERRGRALAAAAQDAGLLAPEAPCPAASEDGRWLVMVYAEGTDETLDKADELAEAYDCEFDGWGEYVGPLNALRRRT